jgi:hypothetical protein
MGCRSKRGFVEEHETGSGLEQAGVYAVRILPASHQVPTAIPLRLPELLKRPGLVCGTLMLATHGAPTARTVQARYVQQAARLLGGRRSNGHTCRRSCRTHRRAVVFCFQVNRDHILCAGSAGQRPRNISIGASQPRAAVQALGVIECVHCPHLAPVVASGPFSCCRPATRVRLPARSGPTTTIPGLDMAIVRAKYCVDCTTLNAVLAPSLATHAILRNS